MPETSERERILVVDDDPMIVELLGLLLSRYWNVFTALSAQEAREVLARESIAVVVADIRMPGETGVELLAWAYETQPSVIRILLTGYADLDAAVDAINRAQAWYYLRKPWNNHELVTLLRRALDYRDSRLALQRAFEGTIRSLVSALEANHPYTSGHSARVIHFTRMICKALGLGSRQTEEYVLAAQLHDIGKIGVDSHYLDKTTALDDAEWANVRRHVAVGHRILRETGFLDHVIPHAMSHHERLDGCGYPAGLSAEQIPLGGRIIAIADAFDAMVSSRAYRAARSIEDALAELRRCGGSHFDPEVVEVFCRCVEADVAAVAALLPREGRG
jgi:response regulator RpfG family c-di-GMP phosphodiesterase